MGQILHGRATTTYAVRAAIQRFLKGVNGESINLLMTACIWNLNKWMRAILLFVFDAELRPATVLNGLIIKLGKLTAYADNQVAYAGQLNTFSGSTS